MLLTIDIGNTNVVFALYAGDDQRGIWRVSTDPRRTADEYAVWLTQLMALEGIQRGNVGGAIICSVVPAATFNLRTLCRRYFGCDPLEVGQEGIEVGIKVLIDRPEQAGADRVVNAVGTRGRYEGPLIIIDFGTATTFDVIDADGNFRGGVIAPGIHLSMEALHMGAARLPRIEIKPTLQVIGKATVPAMQSGIYWGYVSMIEGLVTRIIDEYRAPMTVIATGGLAPVFANATTAIHHVDDDLTQRGLIAVYRRNTRSP